MLDNNFRDKPLFTLGVALGENFADSTIKKSFFVLTQPQISMKKLIPTPGQKILQQDTIQLSHMSFAAIVCRVKVHVVCTCTFFRREMLSACVSARVLSSDETSFASCTIYQHGRMTVDINF